MNRFPTSVSMTIFVLFFGISVLDAFASLNWWRSAFWLAIGLLFLAASWFGRRGERV